MTWTETVARPASLAAEHEYIPAWLNANDSMANEEVNSLIERMILLDHANGEESFIQPIVNGVAPLRTAHWRANRSPADAKTIEESPPPLIGIM